MEMNGGTKNELAQRGTAPPGTSPCTRTIYCPARTERKATAKVANEKLDLQKKCRCHNHNFYNGTFSIMRQDDRPHRFWAPAASTSCKYCTRIVFITAEWRGRGDKPFIHAYIHTYIHLIQFPLLSLFHASFQVRSASGVSYYNWLFHVMLQRRSYKRRKKKKSRRKAHESNGIGLVLMLPLLLLLRKLKSQASSLYLRGWESSQLRPSGRSKYSNKEDTFRVGVETLVPLPAWS